MQRRGVTIAVLACLAAVAAFVGLHGASDAGQKKGNPKPLPKDIVDAWKTAGARVAWVRFEKQGQVRMFGESDAMAGDLPVFQFAGRKAALTRLPAPPVAFGVSLAGDDRATDAEALDLGRFKTLQWLNLERTRVTDAGLKHLSGLKGLQALNLGGTKVTDKGIKELFALDTLRWLNLNHTGVTDIGLTGLPGLKRLQFLSLSGTSVSDAGMKKLTGLKALQTLYLTQTKVTDLATTDLARLKGLQRLNVSQSGVTQAGAAQLRKALPGCTVDR